jgi:hypothetical protein
MQDLRLSFGILMVTLFSLLPFIAGCLPTGPCGDSTTDAGWRCIQIGDAATLAVPKDAQNKDVHAVDSVFGVLAGDGYEVVYDYANVGEDLNAYEDEAEFTQNTRTVSGLIGTEISFEGNGEPWTKVQILQLPVAGKVLTVRASCVNENTCQTAERVLESVRVS